MKINKILLVATTFFACTNIHAAIVSTSGAVSTISSPTSVSANTLESDTAIYAFNEQSNYLLTGDLSVDLLTSTGLSGSLAAGTEVNSHFLHFDPVGTADIYDLVDVTLAGTITFDTPILALIWTGLTDVDPDNLGLSDYLGAVGTTYGTNDVGRGAEMDDSFNFTTDISESRRDYITLIDAYTISVDFYAHPIRADELRVVTAVSAVPVPAAAWLFGSGLIGLLGLARKKRKHNS